jgi:hypothetical protein
MIEYKKVQILELFPIFHLQGFRSLYKVHKKISLWSFYKQEKTKTATKAFNFTFRARGYGLIWDWWYKVVVSMSFTWSKETFARKQLPKTALQTRLL